MENFVGKRIDGRYEIHEVIGVGGMAVVYKAYDRIDDRIVAVKVLKEEYLANEEFRRRFKNESKYIAVLSHPNIVKVFDVHFGDTLQYIVMEYIEGITLKEYIEQQKVIPPKETVYFITQILRALQHAHDKGIVHRDVKPQNIMLLQNGTIKVTDFGIASFSRGDTFTMSDGQAIGSVHYISPEQAKGEFTDARADIYSTGIVMYEMLTGTLPFVGDTAVSIALMQIQQEPKSPREINGSIPIGLEQITLHAMEKDLKCRYQSAASMMLDIDEYKRNNSVKFDYSYFVDNEPTKYIEKTRKTPLPVVESIDPESLPIDDIDQPEEEEKSKNQKLIPILKGIVFGLLGVIAVIMLVLFFFTDTFLPSKFEVPNFVSLNYEEDIKDNLKYKDINIEVDYEFSSQFDYGVVIQQSPKKGKVISKKDKVFLTVNTSKTVPVTDVYGMQYLNAKKALEAAGFTTVYEMVYDATVEEGLVINTTPERDTEAPEGSTVTIHVSTHIDKDAVITPTVVGFTQQDATQEIEAAGLQVGLIEVKDSTQAKGTVISQEPIGGDPLHEGGSVNLVVSSGTAPKVTASVTVPLPKSSSSGKLKAYVNNVAVYSQEVLLNGEPFKFDVTGSGESDSLVVEVDDKTIYTCTMDFTKDPVAVKDAKDIEDYSESFYNSERAVLPNVVGMTESQAVAALKEAGFEHINIVYQTTLDSSKYGTVVSQSPSYSSDQMVSIDATVTISIGKAILG